MIHFLESGELARLGRGDAMPEMKTISVLDFCKEEIGILPLLKEEAEKSSAPPI